MKIEVIKPVRGIVLDFSLDTKTFHILKVSDGKGRESVVNIRRYNSCIPSTALARWCNYYLREELLALGGRGFILTSRDYKTPKEQENWVFRQNPELYGLNEIYYKQTNKLLKVEIEDSIGMKNVVAILVALGYYVEVDFDKETNRVERVKLVKEK